jgi:acetylornithine deacetylase/succinyl-diaminopimelate desuccinylase-like protein|tara:strand:- start:1279 stop:1407 length:129 start_codon:yes stop_codon:yes gene_type:complete
VDPDLGSRDERRFHGNDERIDLESLRPTTALHEDVARDMLGS